MQQCQRRSSDLFSCNGRHRSLGNELHNGELVQWNDHHGKLKLFLRASKRVKLLLGKWIVSRWSRVRLCLCLFIRSKHGRRLHRAIPIHSPHVTHIRGWSGSNEPYLLIQCLFFGLWSVQHRGEQWMVLQWVSREQWRSVHGEFKPIQLYLQLFLLGSAKDWVFGWCCLSNGSTHFDHSPARSGCIGSMWTYEAWSKPKEMS